MPPKRLSDAPPPADSVSSEEDETESEEGESEEEVESDDQNGDAEKQEEADADDDDDEEEEEEEEDENKSPPLKKPTIPATSPMSDPDLDSESTQPSPSLSAFTLKLHKPSPEPNKVGSKRSTESAESDLPSKKKSKAAAGDDEEPKKGSAILRLWSEGDELAILNGLIKYKSEKGADPSADMVAFHEFIKDSLHVDVSKNQLIDKIRRLKKKYRTNIERGENGQDLVFSKTHDLKCFELSKKVWGDKNEVKRNGKVQNGGGSVTLGLPSLGTGRKQIEVKNVEKKSQVKRKEEVKSVEKHQSVENLGEKYPFLGESLNTEGLSEGVKVILGEKLGMLQKGKLEELEHKWKCLKQAELELFVQRKELVNEQVNLALDSIKS